MKVAIVCTFDTYFDRVKLLKEYYSLKHNEVIVITSNFSHRKKQEYINPFADIIIDVKPYYKNLSLARLQSHYDFAKDVKEKLEQIQPDLIHCLIPANSLVKSMAEYKENHDCQLIIDINDLWPETMPINGLEWLPPFKVWKNLREKYLGKADILFTECHLFKEVLQKYKQRKYHVLYWSRLEKPMESHYEYSKDLNFCYLGSMNNIIDIDLIVKLLKECSQYKKTTLHLIGNGESKQSLIDQCKENEIDVIDYHEVYSQEEKQRIFDQCEYGLNVMKPSVVVGLTMKSLDYMLGGLPIINTIQGDTKYFVKTENVGFNVNRDTISSVAQTLSNISKEDMLKQRDNIQKLYQVHFSQEAFFKELDQVLEK